MTSSPLRSPTMPRDSTFARENGSWLPMANTRSSSRRNTATWRPSTSAHTPVFGTMSFSRQTATQPSAGDGRWAMGDASTAPRVSSLIPQPSSLNGLESRLSLVGSSGPDLAALGHEHHVAVRLVAVHEMPESLQCLRVVYRLLPLALVVVNESLHVGLELVTQAGVVLLFD